MLKMIQVTWSVPIVIKGKGEEGLPSLSKDTVMYSKLNKF